MRGPLISLLLYPGPGVSPPRAIFLGDYHAVQKRSQEIQGQEKMRLVLVCFALMFSVSAYPKNIEWYSPDMVQIMWDECESTAEYTVVRYNIYLSLYGLHDTSLARQTTDTQYIILFENKTSRWVCGVSATYLEIATGIEIEGPINWSDGDLNDEAFGWPVLAYPNNLRRK